MPDKPNTYQSECSRVKHLFAPYLTGKIVLEMGAGGDVTVPHALAMDLPNPYAATNSGVRQELRGHCGDLSGFCDGVVSGFATHHLLEDFSYEHLRKIISEWRRVLEPGGVICINCPRQQVYLEHCRKDGTQPNQAHYEHDFSLETFRDRVLAYTGPWEEVMAEPEFPPYSWLLVVRKPA